MNSPKKLAPNIFFHSLYVPWLGWLRTCYQGCIRAVRKQVRQIRPDIVHGQGTERDCAISAVFCGRPNVLTIHGNMRTIARVTGAKALSPVWFAARLEALTVPRSDGVVCITRHTQQAVSGLARRTWVVPNAVDVAFFGVQRQGRQAPPVILCVGMVTQLKNQNALIRALDDLARQHRFTVVFMGKATRETAYGREFLDLVEQRPWCQYFGFATRAQVREGLGGATALVMPSLEENCPMSVIEAMAAGVPVAAARVGGIPDLVEPGVTGCLFDPLNLADMRESVRRLLENPTGAEGLAERARKFATQNLRPEAIARRHAEVYREVLRGRA